MTTQPELPAIRQFLIALLSELQPDTVMITYLDGKGPRTAAMMIDGLREGDDVAKQWASDLLRVARDFVIRKQTDNQP